MTKIICPVADEKGECYNFGIRKLEWEFEGMVITFNLCKKHYLKGFAIRQGLIIKKQSKS